jgi:long-chain acyl-CoA synthetase
MPRRPATEHNQDIIYSGGIRLGEQPVNIASVIENHAADRVAIIDGDASISYGELRAWAAAIRQLLKDRGVGPDDRVAIPAGNEPAFVAAMLGALGVGARVIPMKPTNPLPELDRKLASIRPTIILVGEDAAWMHDHADGITAPLVDLRDVPRAADAAPEIVDRSSDDIAIMMLTSGVSGNAKVAMLSHGNLAWAQAAVCENSPDGLHADDVALAVLPFSHIFGLNVILLASLRQGGQVVLERRFDVADSLALCQRHGITVLGGAPPMWRQWSLVDPSTDAFASVRIAASGAAALPVEVFEAMRDRHGVLIEEGYGLTETSPIVTSSRGDAKAGSVGRPADGIDVILVEDDGSPVDVGDAGEIVVRGPGVFQGYYDDEAATQDVLTPDGWFWTGDVGVLDEEGRLYIVDRLKDIIIVSGFNVYPAEVENVLLEHPDVRGAVVVGTIHLDTGEAVVAHVSGDVDTEELDRHARANLSRYKCPTAYHLVDELPVAPTGKKIRRELR